MVAVIANNVSLAYPVRSRLRLSLRSGSAMTGGVLGSERGNQFVTALNNVSFSLEAGDRLGLVGTNGAGKTSLLKVLYGIYQPTGGAVVMDGRVDALFNISLGFRRESSGRRNVVIRGLINGWTHEQIEARMDDIIGFSELGEFIDMPFKTYSQGMAARLAFSVATSCEPHILLMDEWIGAGDPPFQEKARRRMNELAERAGIIVLASHNNVLLKRTCNKILELSGGTVKSFGPADAWFESRN